MRTMWRILVGVSLMMLLFTLSAGHVALADPINNPNTFTADLECGTETVTVVALPAGSPTLLIVDTTGGFLLTQVDFTIVETGATGTALYGAGYGQADGIQDDLVTCTTSLVRDGLTFVFELTGFFVPR